MPRKRKKIYVDVPYLLRNAAKNIGAMWDSDKKKWFIWTMFPDHNNACETKGWNNKKIKNIRIARYKNIFSYSFYVF